MSNEEKSESESAIDADTPIGDETANEFIDAMIEHSKSIDKPLNLFLIRRGSYNADVVKVIGNQNRVSFRYNDDIIKIGRAHV